MCHLRFISVLSLFCFQSSFAKDLLVSGKHLQFSLRELSEAQNGIFKWGFLRSKKKKKSQAIKRLLHADYVHVGLSAELSLNPTPHPQRGPSAIVFQ